MDLGLQGKAAIVTAASKGLGRGTALALAVDGCALVLNARGAEGLEAVADECRALGAPVTAIAGDATDPALPDELVGRAISEFGRLDIAVANAGGPPPGRALDVSDEALHAAFEQNMVSSARLLRAALEPMRASGWGRLLAISSATVRQPQSVLALSNVARTGLYAWIKTLATDLAGDPATRGITANLVGPGLHDTDRIRSLYGTNVPDHVGDAEDFGRVVAFLASTSASYLTGQAVLVDGGATLGL